MLAQGKGVSLSVDGTFKLFKDGYVLIPLMSHTNVSKSTSRSSAISKTAEYVFGGDNAYSQSGRVLLFAVSNTENIIATKHLLIAYKKVCEEFLQISSEQYTVQSIHMDHSEALRSSALEVFPDCLILNCYAHLSRNVLKELKKVESGRYTKMVQDHIHECHLATDEIVFKALVTSAISEWSKYESLSHFIVWFSNSYLAEKWNNWWIGASGVYGNGSTTNYQESYNRAIKGSGVLEHQYKLGDFLVNQFHQPCWKKQQI